MGANLYVRKWGGSLAVRIPKAIAEQLGVSEGSAIELDARGGQVEMLKRKYDLDDLLAGVTPENLHPEQDIGEARGEKEW